MSRHPARRRRARDLVAQQAFLFDDIAVGVEGEAHQPARKERPDHQVALPFGEHLAGDESGPARCNHGIVNLSDLAEKEPHSPGQAAFNSHVMSSQMM